MNNLAKNITYTADTNTTPMMRQYLAIKEAHNDYLLFYRMGDFYELFFGDAVKASKALDIALTKRGKHCGEDIPMCGVPVHSHTSYLHKLIKNGFKVAICEQTEDPKEAKKRGAKSVVNREVMRIITPGTLTEDTLLKSRSSNFLAALTGKKDDLGLAWLDISTGEFFTSVACVNSIASSLLRINPKEILIPDKLLEDANFREILGDWKPILTPYVNSFFDSLKGETKLKNFYGVISLDSFGSFTRSELGSCGALLEYVELTQKGNLPRLSIPKKFTTSDFMSIDAATRNNLELVSTTSGEYKGSLLSVIDRTVTSFGARLLHKNLGAPLIDDNAINNRLDMVQFFIDKPDIRSNLRDILKKTPDMERALSRLYMGRGSPRDIAVIRDGLIQGGTISAMLSLEINDIDCSGIKSLVTGIADNSELIILLKNTLVDIPPPLTRDGGFIKSGYHPKLDEYRNINVDGNRLKAELCDTYRKESGITSLKIKDNNVLGMFIEVTPQHVAKIPEHFTHRQTLAGAVRYTTQELRELENKIINAKGYALELEIEIFRELCTATSEKSDDISLTAQSMAGFDVFSSLAELAAEKRYSRPVVDNSLSFNIKGGRHPVVENVSEIDFISNGCDLSAEKSLWLITGPNMAGKSTFLRQNALIAILAQIGSFVPADSAHIGTIDSVFSRVGAADDLARGRSTFMVEMVETATIINSATSRSLVILDEIGRGTATFDGLSIAWAVIEHLHEKNRCRTLFATHYHELTALALRLERLVCYTMKVREWNDDVIFMHEVIAGIADRSYGIHVGKLAGLPKTVINRAQEILDTLEEGESANAAAKLAEELPLFSGMQESQNPAVESETDSRLRSLDIDNLSPKQALDTLYELRTKLH